MARYSRGAQLGDSQRNAGREQRRQQIAHQRRQERLQRTKRLARKGIAILAVIGLLVLLFDRQFVRYSNDAIKEPYATTVNSYFDDNPIRKSRLFFSADDFKNYVISKHPDVADIRVEQSLLGNARFVLIERQPTFVWDAPGAYRYIGDSEGVIYDEHEMLPTDGFTGEIKPGTLRFIDQSRLRPQIGEQVLSRFTLDFVNNVQAELKDGSLVPEWYSVPPTAREIHVHFKDKSYYAKFSLDRSVAGQLEELRKAYRYLTRTKTSVSQYIDLRTEDKVYYK